MPNFAANLLLPTLLASGASAVQDAAPLESQRTVVAIAEEGDDCWSRRLTRAVRRQFRAMPDFRVVEEATSPDTLRVILLHHFHEQQGGTVTYGLRIGRGTRVTALPAGACSADQPEECARQIARAVHSARNWLANPAE